LADRYLVGHAVDEAGADAGAEADGDDDAAAAARDDAVGEAVADAPVDAAPDDDAVVGFAGGAVEDEDDGPAVHPATATPITAAAAITAAGRPADLVEPSIPTSFRGPGTAAKRDTKSRCLYDF
jgi:hypothetical protein